ncbi:amidohydrolase family protein [Polycladidibacter hongkongensis]|uniref:amidohydrolase family protein n=1 Tax=Polycladidibacter hongkongensis TaxID=1647556 RepID=UPI00082D7F2D|nr:amidohydrolase family protein [Pseudovibrio hongkongensis]
MKKKQLHTSGLDRRQFLAGTTAALALASAPGLAWAKGEAGSWVDAHCHAWSSDLSRYPMNKGRTREDLKPTDVSASGLLQLEKPLRVNKIVLVQHIWYHGLDSSYLTDAAKEHPGQFAVVGAVGETNEQGPALMLEKKAEGVKGFRVRGFGTADWVASPIMNEMFKVAANENLNICPLIRNNAKMDDDALLHIAALCDKHPQTRVVIDHMGTVMPGDDKQLGRLLALAKRENVFVKVSGFNKFDLPPYDKLKSQIAKLIEAYGVERLMWGSDLPVLEYEKPHNLQASFDLINSGLGLSADEKQWLLAGAAEKAFFS